MIAMLRGKPAHRLGSAIVLDVSGVGYRVHLPTALLDEVEHADEITLHIATIVREDAFTLYGFSSPDQREAFGLLREVKGVGPRLAMAILSHLPLSDLVAALLSEDTGRLVGVSGVGQRTASRLILELKNKIPPHFQVAASTGPARRHPTDPLPLALAQLGYRKSEIDIILASPSVPGMDEAPIEQRLSAALRTLQSP